MIRKMIKKNTENEEEDYIIDNDQEIEDFEDNNNYNNNNAKNKISMPKEQNKNNKSPKMSYRSGGEWVKESKEKFKQEKNRNNNISKTESRISDNKKINKKIMNFDDMPVGGGGMRREADFNIEIKVPAKKNKFIEKNNNNIKDDYEENFVYTKKLNSKEKFGDDLDTRKNNNKNLNNDYYEENNNNNDQAEMERKNSLVSMVTQTCDREMVGRSEFIEIPVDQHNLAQNINNNSEINFDSNIVRLSDNKQTFSISKKNTGFKDNFEMSNFSNINRLTDYSASQNCREKTENVIQLQNVQRELDNEIEMNKRLQGQIENYKNEFNNLREELVKKSDIINELQQKISKLEKDLFLQGNQLIEAESKPSQEHYEDIVNNYEEMKKNFDKAVERIKFLSDENAELKEKNMRLEESNKKLKKEKVSNINQNKNINKNKKSFNTYQNEFENENDYYNQNEENINQEYDHNNDIPDNKKSNENYIKNNNKFNENITNERTDNINNEEVRKEAKEKRSIIPEDNDIFGTRGLENKKNTQKPRKIQEDGIPVIKRMEEKDNVKDIMVNNYATNDDDYYNRPPIGKPKARRIKRNTINNNNTSTNVHNNKNNDFENKINNYGEPKIKMTSSKIRKNNNNDYNDNDFKSNSNNDDNYNDNNNNDNNNYYNFNKLRNNKGNQNLRNVKSKTTTSVGIFPSQIKGIVNEKEILDLESKLYNLQKERDIVNDEYLKFPEYPKKREEINAKKKLEIKLEEMNKEISLQKLKIRELKEQNK